MTILLHHPLRAHVDQFDSLALQQTIVMVDVLLNPSPSLTRP